jgi:hypothetical protein
MRSVRSARMASTAARTASSTASMRARSASISYGCPVAGSRTAAGAVSGWRRVQVAGSVAGSAAGRRVRGSARPVRSRRRSGRPSAGARSGRGTRAAGGRSPGGRPVRAACHCRCSIPTPAACGQATRDRACGYPPWGVSARVSLVERNNFTMDQVPPVDRTRGPDFRI